MAGDGQNLAFEARFCPMGHPVRDNPRLISAMKKLCRNCPCRLAVTAGRKNLKLCGRSFPRLCRGKEHNRIPMLVSIENLPLYSLVSRN